MNNDKSARLMPPTAPESASGDFIDKIGRLPDLERGQMVWIRVQGMWRAGQVGRRLPGHVWWVSLDESVGGCRNFVVHVGNFGGPWGC